MSTPARQRRAARTPEVFAPGARVEIRDEEWIVRSSNAATYGGYAVKVTGLSELVRGRHAIFLSELDEIRELAPEETVLVPDESAKFLRTRLYLESLLRRTPPTDPALHIGHRAAIRPTNYQMQPAAKALRQLRPRILMADGVGLGKTIEVGILLTELIRRGRGDRILVVALKSILEQFQMEMWGRFTIPLVRLDSVGIQRIQSKIPSNMNPFHYYDRVIISIDTLKRDAKYRRYLEDCDWDVIVVDECQNVADRSQSSSSQKSQRARLAELLATKCDSLIFTSATPHDGRAESFASLINLLEPTAIADPENYTSEEVQDYFLRRFKKDVAEEVDGGFLDRRQKTDKLSASDPENAFFGAIRKAEFRTVARGKKAKGVLFRTLLLKAFLSSPAACIATIDERIRKLEQREREGDVARDLETLAELRTFAAAVDAARFTKYQALRAKLADSLREPEDRVVLFSERIATLDFLRDRLRKDLGLKASEIAMFHGTLDDQKQAALVKDFGTRDSSIKILLASDAASEGINLHYFCHRLIHFDLPWSLITLEQRNGRIDRYGQSRHPEISYLLTIPASDSLRGDLRILDRLIEKEQEANKNLGDVAWFLHLHDNEKEEVRIGQSIEEGEAPEDVIPDKPAPDPLQAILGVGSEADGDVEKQDPVMLFPDDLAFTREAVHQAGLLQDDDDGLSIEWLDHASGFRLDWRDAGHGAAADLERRYDFLPSELTRGRSAFRLTTDRKAVMESFDVARQTKDTWPEWELLWELHPIALWINDLVLAFFDRHEAPVLPLSRGVDRGETIVLFQGVFSNRRSQPVLVDWFGLRMGADGKPTTDPVLSLRDLIERTGLDGNIANVGRAISDPKCKELAALLSAAVEAARVHLDVRRKARAAEIGDELRGGLRAVIRWHDRVLAQIRERREAARKRAGRELTEPQRKRFERDERRANEVFQSRKDWIEMGMKTVEQPHVRVAAVLIHEEDAGGA